MQKWIHLSTAYFINKKTLKDVAETFASSYCMEHLLGVTDMYYVSCNT